MPTQQDTWRANQAAKQAEDRPFPLKCPLDFASFEDAIRALKPERIAELDAFLPTATVPDIQRKFADGSLTCAELVAYYVRRIQQHDGRLNAILELNPDALRLAQEFDAQLLAHSQAHPQPLPPGGGKLRGIPILLKDNIATGDGMHTTAGAAALRDVRFPRDAFLVQRLREAGAIILGKTNMSEWANFMTNESLNGFSALGGQTRNPRGAFDVSGSSSGSGAAIAANFAALAIGTETSGSIIAPSTQNGVCGLKPSLGLVSRDAIIPITDAQDTAGPMTRNMSDLALLFDVICARDPSDPMSFFAGEIQRSDRYELTGKRIGLVRATLEREHDAEMAAKAICVLQSTGAEVVDVIITSSSPQSSADVLPMYHAGFLRGVNAWLAEAGAGLTVADVIAFNTRDLANCAPQGMDLLEKSGASEMSAADYEAAVLRNRMLCQQAIRNTLANYKVDFLMAMGYGLVFLAACAGFPSLSIPAGLAASGEPVGLLLVGNYLADWDLVGAGLAFEEMRNEK